MKIRVRLIGQFMQRFGFGEKDLLFRGTVTTGALIARLGMAKLDHVATREGLPLGAKDRLADGDRVVIAPIFSGG